MVFYSCLFLPPTYLIVQLQFICTEVSEFLDTNPLSDMHFENIFFYSVACLCIHLIVSFTKQNFKILIQFNLSMFSFMDYSFDISKNTPPNSKSHHFPLKMFIVLHFTYRSILTILSSLIHELRIFLSLFRTLISLINVLSFSVYKSYTYSDQFISIFGDLVHGIIF